MSRFSRKKQWRILALIVGGLFGVWRMFWFSHSQVPLGYDPGLYIATFRDYAQLRNHFNFSVLGNWNRHEPFLAMIASGLHKLGINYNWIVRRGIGIINWLLGLLLFFVFKKKSLILGTMTAVLYWLSLTQYEAFYWGYFKQIIGIGFLLLTLILLERKKYWGILMSLVFLAPLHRTSLLITVVIVVIYMLYESVHQRKFPRKLLLVLAIAAVWTLGVYFPLWQKLIGDNISHLTGTFGGSGFSGDFLDIFAWIKIGFVSTLLALFGVYLQLKKDHDEIGPRVFGFFVTLVWVVIKLFNYNRIIIFLDIFVIIFAAQALFFLWEQKHIIFKYFVGVIVIVLSLQYIYGIQSHDKALISQHEFAGIQKLAETTEKNAIIMTTHRNYTPWIMGYSERARLAPGISDLNERGFSEREMWRRGDGQSKCNLLKNSYKKLHKPIYLWYGIGQFAENFEHGDCFQIYEEGEDYFVLKITLQ